MYITANVPTSEIGSARLGMAVADRLRRNRKMTMITSNSGQQKRELHVFHRLRTGMERSMATMQLHGRRQFLRQLRQHRQNVVHHFGVLVPGWRCTCKLMCA